MGFLGKLFGGPSEAKQPRTARETLPLAQEALNNWSPAQAPSAQLCCVYTSGEDANRELGKDGRSRAWHFDFYLEKSRSFYLVRVVDGKAKGWERPLSEKPVEYIYCVYGAEGGEKAFPEPIALPPSWVDSPDVAQGALVALNREMAGTERGILEDYILLSLFLPARYIRYGQPNAEPKLLTKPVPADLCYAAVLGHIDVDQHDALVVYVNAATGQEAAVERFRFPALVTIGWSADW